MSCTLIAPCAGFVRLIVALPTHRVFQCGNAHTLLDGTPPRLGERRPAVVEIKPAGVGQRACLDCQGALEARASRNRKYCERCRRRRDNAVKARYTKATR